MGRRESPFWIRMVYADVRSSPPYKPSDKPNPLNLYGKLKEAGEQAVLKSTQARTSGQGALVLRVPLLYVFPEQTVK